MLYIPSKIDENLLLYWGKGDAIKVAGWSIAHWYYIVILFINKNKTLTLSQIMAQVHFSLCSSFCCHIKIFWGPARKKWCWMIPWWNLREETCSCRWQQEWSWYCHTGQDLKQWFLNHLHFSCSFASLLDRTQLHLQI